MAGLANFKKIPSLESSMGLNYTQIVITTLLHPLTFVEENTYKGALVAYLIAIAWRSSPSETELPLVAIKLSESIPS
jgi:hypothetical protein